MLATMKISKLYTNFNELFTPIEFYDGVNVVIAEIRLPENKNKSSHNLGKTTLGKVIDFCLLKDRDQDFFLFRHADVFGAFVFFIEIEIYEKAYVTIRRSVENPSKISFKYHDTRYLDLVNTPDDLWDHVNIPFEKGRALLDGSLDLRALSPWRFRHILGYLLRMQEDYGDVFHLDKFRGKHSDWKPFMAHILGLKSSLLTAQYDKEEQLSKEEQRKATIQSEMPIGILEPSKVDAMLAIKTNEIEKKQFQLDAFDFRKIDKEKTLEVINDLDEQLAALNNERHSLLQSKKKISKSLQQDKISFDIREISELFSEAGVVFPGQLKKDFEQLLAFNKAISEERSLYLEDELNSIEDEARKISSKITNLGKKRIDTLSYIKDSDHISKYKTLSDELVTLKADVEILERQKEHLGRMREISQTINKYKDELAQLQHAIDNDLVDSQSSKKIGIFSNIRQYFNEIIDFVIGENAVLRASLNAQGHVDFHAEIIGKGGKLTSADSGNTYKKLLCIAFDLALLRAHLVHSFPRFVFHDGVFEVLEPRKKTKLLSVIQEYNTFGLQQIITMISSDMPVSEDGEPAFDESEFILRLHDEGDSGRLFKMPKW